MSKILYFITFSSLVFANEHMSLAEQLHKTDIIPRTVNFIIFALILFKLLYKPMVNFFKERKNKIANRLNEVQDKLRQTKMAKEKALEDLENSKKVASEILETAKEEIEIFKEKNEEDLKQELIALEKSYKDKEEVEKRKTIRKVVSGIVEEIFEDPSVKLSNNEIVDILVKKAS